MAFLEQHPLHVRKKIALGITIGSAVLLCIVLLLVYIGRSSRHTGDQKQSVFLRFYATILGNAQSFFGSSRGIIDK